MLTCDSAQRSLSALADGEAPDAPPAEVHDHVAGCDDCRAFDEHIHAVRQLLRFEPVEDDDVPDLMRSLAPRLRHAPRWHQRRRWLPAVAAAVAGAVAGATFVGIGGEPDRVAAADLPTRVVEEQAAMSTLAADVTVESAGTTWTGTLRYRAPEDLAVVLHDDAGTALATVAEGDRWWIAGPRRCAPAARDACAPPTLRSLAGRAPFSDDAPVPLELVAPVDALARAGTLSPLPERDGLVGVSVTAGQVAGLLEGIDPTGALGPVHPTDPVDLWLDAEHLVPVEVVVRAAATPERARWAAARGLDDGAGDELLRVALDDLVVDGALPADAFPPPPPNATRADAGFDDAAEPDGAPVPADLPEGFTPGRDGRAGDVAVRTWSDGRAWLAVRATAGWAGTRLFGDVGTFVTPVDLGAGGVGYRSADGTRLAVHADGLDVVVVGSVGPDALRRVAASLGVVGVEVPAGWAEAATATLAEATAVAPDLLVPAGLDGFRGPAVRIDGEEVTLRYTGPGDRAFVVVRAPWEQVKPPLDPEVLAVPVRGLAGRWRPATGDVEWVEDGHARALRSATLPLAELLAIAEQLRPV